MTRQKRPHKALAAFLALLMLAQLLPGAALAGFTNEEGTPAKNGDVLFADRHFVSETEYPLAEGVTEYVTYTNNSEGRDQNIDYFCEIDMTKAKLMAGYANMSTLLEGGEMKWQMQTVSDQVKETQKYLTAHPDKYPNYQIVAAINADYYNMATGQPTGLLVINGKQYNPPVSGGYYHWFGITRDGKPMISDSTDPAVIATLEYAISGGIVLVHEGQVQNISEARNVTYSAIGYKADGTIVTMVSHGQSYPVSCGYSQTEVAEMMAARGCVEALLLDGSGSATYVSRREGDEETHTRNSPSDGQERQVSSSLFIISTGASDGIFNHAAIEPNNVVYTPGSTVQFTARGVDKSGGPAPLPEDLSWSLSDPDMGDVESATGEFTAAEGVTGEVTVKLFTDKGSREVGSTTITIAAPDEISFSADTVSVAQDGSSDLGLQVRYNQRDVKYKDGDFIWTIAPTEYTRKQWASGEGKDAKYEAVQETEPDRMQYLTMGSIINNIFYCDLGYTGTNTQHPEHVLEAAEKLVSSAKATVTAVSSFDESVFGSVALETGKEPMVAMDFEEPDATILHGKTANGENDVAGIFDDNGVYHQGETGGESEMICLSYTGRNYDEGVQVGKLSIVDRSSGPVRFGNYAARLDYDFTSNADKTDGACFGFNKEITLEGNPTKIGLWVYVPEGTPSLWLRLRYRDGTGNTSQIDFTKQDMDDQDGLQYKADNSWHYYEADISQLATPVSFPAGMAIRVMVLTYAGSKVGWMLGNGQKIDRSQNHGTLFFDNLTYVYGSTTEDTEEPYIDSVIVNSTEELTDGMEFDSGDIGIRAYYDDDTSRYTFNTGIDTRATNVYVDGYMLNANAQSTELNCALHLSKGHHIIKLYVTDLNGNENIKTYNIYVKGDENGDVPVTMSSTASSAILGKDVTLHFDSRKDNSQSMEVKLAIDQAFKDNITLIPGEGCKSGGDPEYDDITRTVHFKVTGNNPSADLVFKVPETAVVGTQFTAQVVYGRLYTGNTHATDDQLFASQYFSIPVEAPYSVTSGTMVRGMEETLSFTVIDNATGEPASGIAVRKTDGTQIGTSDESGKVAYKPAEGDTLVTVQAVDGNGSSISGTYQVQIFDKVEADDGKPIHVWQNADRWLDSLNVSWISSPGHAAGSAVMKVSVNADMTDAREYTGEAKLTGFNGGNALTAAYVCSADTSGLENDTTYYYQVGDGTEDNWSDIRSFTTGFGMTGTEGLILGDLQEDDNTVVSQILDYVGVNNKDFVIQTGDFVDSGSTYAYWDNTLGMLDSIVIPRFFALGNHEKEGGLRISQLMYNRENNDYYSTQIGNVYIATINHAGGEIGYEKELEWLVEDASKSNATWKILVTHGPAYYSNPDGGSETAHDLIPAAVQAAGIDVVLSGHDHSYARTEPLFNGSVDPEKGITYFICGALGEKGYAAVDNKDFHFAKLTDEFKAAYLTFSTTDTELTIRAYDFKGVDGEGKANVELIDSFTKTKGDTEHVHEFTWNGKNQLTCQCGYSLSSKNYTGYANYTLGDKSGQVYLSQGKLQTDTFAAGEDTILHAGKDGFIHDCETINTAGCWEDGYLCCLCHDCNILFQFSETRRQGHLYNDQMICTRTLYSMETFSYYTCGHHGTDIASLNIRLGYTYGFYNGSAKRPPVFITETLPDGTTKDLLAQSTYGDYMIYYDNNVNVGRATIRIEGYSDGPYYGSTELTFDIVPTNISDLTVASQTSNSVTLSWGASKGAEYYIVYRYDADEEKWVRLAEDVTATTYTATGLEPGEQQFRIRPYTPVDGELFYSTKNSNVVKTTLTGDVSFTEAAVEKEYGSGKFTNAAIDRDESSEGFTYESSDTSVATVDASTGEVTVVGAGRVIITATKDGKSGQYTLTVKPITVSLTWTGAETRIYDGAASAVTAAAGGVRVGDTVTVTVVGGDARDAGEHTARATALSSANYALPEDREKTYTITPRDLAITWSNTELTYSAAKQSPTATPGEGLVDGDTVTFNVPGATDVGTYRTSAASLNPNYTVRDSGTSFTISMPVITLSDENVTYTVEGSTIHVFGNAGSVRVTLRALNGGSGSATVGSTEDNRQGAVTLNGVVYLIDGSGLVKPEAEVTLGATSADLGEEIPEESAETVKPAAEDEANAFGGVAPAVSGSADELAAEALESAEEKEVTVEVSMSLTAVGFSAEDGLYSVDITPVYVVKVDGEALGESRTLPNSAILAPVTVTIKVPAGLTLDEHTYIRHTMEDGAVEYIKPQVDSENMTVTFKTASFSLFTVCTDSRSVTVTFEEAEGGTITRVYGPEDIGKSLPGGPWTIEEEVYSSVTEELLDLNRAVTATPYTPPEPEYVSLYRVNLAEAKYGTVTSNYQYAPAGCVVTLTTTLQKGAELKSLDVTTADGAELVVKDLGDGRFTFVMPAADVYVELVFEDTAAVCPSAIFTDVPAGAWFHSAVDFVVERGLMKGVSDDRFSPGGKITRAMVVTILYRIEGEPEPGKMTFTDVPGGKWYTDAVAWAAGNGIVEGFDELTFGPERNITREQLSTILHRYAEFKGMDVTMSADLSAFTDSSLIASWALQPMRWANARGLINGVADTTLLPKGDATRAQAAAVFMRLLKDEEK